MKPSPLLNLPAHTTAAPAVQGATPMSEVRRRTRAKPRHFSATSTLARASLALPLIAMSTSACLITDPPQFTAPQHTAPFLLQQTANPDPGQILVVNDVDLPSEITFSAQVVSQDDSSPSAGAFYEIRTKLYIDYGFTDQPGKPFIWELDGTTIGAGTIETAGRLVAAQWDPAFNTVPDGCHTATLVASHIFDDQRLNDTDCPVCADDYSTITWTMLRCNAGMTGTHFDCTELPVMGPTSCAGLTSSCAQVLADAGPGAPICPETVDGGAGGGGS